MFSTILVLAASAWVAVTAPAESLRRFDTASLYQSYINEVEYMGLGCLAGAAAGATVGAMPVVTSFGTVVTPYSVPQAALIGCTAGAAVTGVSAKLYNAGVLYAKYARIKYLKSDAE